MVAFLPRIALFGTALQCIIGLRRGKQGQGDLQLDGYAECPYPSSGAEFVSDITEIDNVTYYDQAPPFLVTFWAPWCPWSRRFVTDGGQDSAIERLNRELQSSGVQVFKYNVGGRGLPSVPRPPGFAHPYVPTVYLVAADGSKVRYEGDPTDVQRLAGFARGEQQPVSAQWDQQSMEIEPRQKPQFVSEIPEIDDVTYNDQTPPSLITFWAPWCPWSRRFVTDGGDDAAIEQLDRDLQGSGVAVLKYNVGGRGLPRVPRPPGFEWAYIPSVWRENADGSKVRYEGDPTDVQSLASFARGEQQPMASGGETAAAVRGCADTDTPSSNADIPQIDNETFSSLTPPFLITFWAPWCPWSRRFVTNGGSDAPIERVHRGLEAVGGPAIVKYDVGGRGSPSVPLPPGFTIRGIPTTFKVARNGAKVSYPGDPTEVDALIAWAME